MFTKRLQFAFACALATSIAGASLVTAADDAEDGAKPAPPAASNYLRVKEILGSKVSIEGDTSVGIVDDIVLDEHGNVDYVIVLDEGKLVTVPWDAAVFYPQKKAAKVHIAPERYREVPRYTVDEYPVFNTPDYRVQTYKYYGLTPAQERRALRRARIETRKLKTAP